MDYRDINDYEMLYMIGERDEIAYGTMYTKYYPLIASMARKYYENYKGYGIDYDDLYQEGIVALNNAIREFNDKNNCLFYTYAIICIKREMERLLKKSVRLKHMILNNALSLDQTIGDNDLYVEDVMEDSKENIDKNLLDVFFSKKILDLKYELSDRQSLVYELKLNNFSNREIAALLDINYKAVDNSLKLIKNKLKKYLNYIYEYVL